MSDTAGVEVTVGNLSWSIGAVEIVRVEENILGLPTKVLVPDITDEQIEADRDWLAPYFDPPNEDGEPMLRLSLHSFVVRTAGVTIVVDTCVGPDPERALQGDPGFAERLAASIDGGLEAVDVVVCTHLHFDHVGWNTVSVDGRLVPTFPNARYLITRPEIEEMERDDHMAVNEPSVRPLAEARVLDVIELDSDSDSNTDSNSDSDTDSKTDSDTDSDRDGYRNTGHAITDEVRLIATPGHTPGHVSVLIESGGRQGLITGDAFHSPIQFAHPELAAWRFDSDAEQSSATRCSLIDRFVDTEALVLGTHFAPPTAGRLRRRHGATEHANGVWFDADSPSPT